MQRSTIDRERYADLVGNHEREWFYFGLGLGLSLPL